MRSKTGIPQTTEKTGRLGYGTSGIGGAYQPREVVGECLRTQPTWSPAATQTILAWATRHYREELLDPSFGDPPPPEPRAECSAVRGADPGMRWRRPGDSPACLVTSGKVTRSSTLDEPCQAGHRVPVPCRHRASVVALDIGRHGRGRQNTVGAQLIDDATSNPHLIWRQQGRIMA